MKTEIKFPRFSCINYGPRSAHDGAHRFEAGSDVGLGLWRWVPVNFGCTSMREPPPKKKKNKKMKQIQRKKSHAQLLMLIQ